MTSPAGDGKSRATAEQEQRIADRRQSRITILQATLGYSYLGIFWGVAIFIGYAAGRWAEKRWHFETWGSLVGVLIGIAAGFRELIRVTTRHRQLLAAAAKDRKEGE